VLSAAEYDWKQAAGTVSVSGLEKDVQNVGKEAAINLLESRIKNAEKTLKNQITVSMYGDGTGTGGKELDGLKKLVADTPTTGTVGGINRATSTNSWWRNQTYDATTDGSAAATALLIQGYMNEMYLRCSRGNDKTNLIMSDKNYYKLYWSSLQAIQRVTREDRAGAGFEELVFANNVPVVYEDSTGIAANHMYFLNTDYLFFRYAENRNFTPMEKRSPINQDAEVHLILFAGNLTMSNASVNGILKD